MLKHLLFIIFASMALTRAVMAENYFYYSSTTNSGVITGENILNLEGSFLNDSTGRINPSYQLYNGEKASFTNDGEIYFFYDGSGPVSLYNEGYFVNDGLISRDISMSLQNHSFQTYFENIKGTFINSGTIDFEEKNVFVNRGDFTNIGGSAIIGDLAAINYGHFSISDGGSITSSNFVNDNLGTFGGSGSINLSTFTNFGLLEAGDDSAGLVINGNFIQEDSGTLRIEISDTSTLDILSITGTASLGGTLDIVVDESLDLDSITNSFTLLQAAVLQGTFSNILVPGGWELLVANLDSGDDSGELHSYKLIKTATVGAQGVVPIPNATILLGPILIGLFAFRKKLAA